MDDQFNDPAEGRVVKRIIDKGFELVRILDDKRDDLLRVHDRSAGDGGDGRSAGKSSHRSISSGANFLPSKSRLALPGCGKFPNGSVCSPQEFSYKIAARLLGECNG